jgi:hypothetical protein
MAIFGCGCAVQTKSRNIESTRQDFLDQYAELLDGKVALIADFEDQDQELLFDVVSASGRALAKIERLSARSNRSALNCTLVDPNDAVIIDNSRTVNAALKRDWRDFDLLLARILAPDRPVVIDVYIASGLNDSRMQTGTTVPLEKGWNFVRLDLSEAVERIDMSDIRQISFKLAGKDTPAAVEKRGSTQEPVSMVIDDIILAQNRGILYGRPDNNDGSMYVQNQGRRWRVGAGGNFELVFSQGQIVGWYDLIKDTQRTTNLVMSCAMGPMPTVLPEFPGEIDEHAPDFTDFGATVHTRQRVIEMNNVRVIIECEWSYSKDPSQAPSGEPIHQWRYAVYRTGQMYIDLKCRTRIGDWSVDSVGLALCVDQILGAENTEHSTAQLESPEELRHVCFAAAADRSGTPAILFVAHDGRSAPQANVISDPRENRLILLLSGGRIDQPTQHWSCMVNLRPSQHDPEYHFGREALAYAEPMLPSIQGGRIKRGVNGDSDEDGFDESLGTYHIDAFEEPLTITFNRSDPGKDKQTHQRVESPAIAVHGVQATHIRATVNGRQLPDSQTAVTSTGEFLLQLPGPINSKTEVVITNSPQLAQSPQSSPLLSQPSFR